MEIASREGNVCSAVLGLHCGNGTQTGGSQPTSFCKEVGEGEKQ